ncbi:unnamed protein product [Cyprideis torosa]|uniref:Uncharacterized protein n=1 Tax=Cyprideis torosa TaxID=163714 RepID=A0A7R8ZSA2_9CRUS|nr:unnamed protein product [Cyprideis torosa]CAG0901134.1 unnamed protein product [Cyprideis torosa]
MLRTVPSPNTYKWEQGLQLVKPQRSLHRFNGCACQRSPSVEIGSDQGPFDDTMEVNSTRDSSTSDEATSSGMSGCNTLTKAKIGESLECRSKDILRHHVRRMSRSTEPMDLSNGLEVY